MWKLQVPRPIRSIHSARMEPRLSNVVPAMASGSTPDDEWGPCLADILREECVKLNLEAGGKDETIAELIDLLVRTNGVKSREAALAAVSDRERLGSTGLGNGVALPHATDHQIEQVAAALGVSQRGVDFGAPDGKPAHVVFLFLGRTDCPQANLHALDQAARLLYAPGFVDIALESTSPADVISFIHEGTWLSA